MTETTATDTQCRPVFPGWTMAALAIAVVSVAGSLWLSIGMGLKACPLCLYERTFMMALAGVLFFGVLRSRAAKPGFLVLLCVPLAIGGLGVAAFHVYLELTGVLECPASVLGLGSAPQQSLGVYVLVAALLGTALARSPAGST